MKVSIIENPDYTNAVKVGIDCDPECDPLKFFLSGIDITNLSTLIEKAILSEGYGAEYTAVRFYGNQDEYDIVNGGFSEDEVEVYHHVIGEVILKKIFFYRVIYKYAQKVLELYEHKATVSENWGTLLKSKLQELELAIKNEV